MACFWWWGKEPEELAWASCESARLILMRPGFESCTWRHKWIEFCFRRRPSFVSFSPFFLFPISKNIVIVDQK